MAILKIVAFLFLFLIFIVPAKADLPWAQLIAKFLVLDESANESAVKIEGFSTSPFGVLVHWAANGDLATCSSTHVSLGKLLTASHCLKGGKDPENYRVLYFDKKGTKKMAKITAITFEGDLKIDAAVLEMNPSEVQDWDFVGGDVRTYDARVIASKVAEREAVKAWSFTPLKSDSAASAKFRDGIGAIFRPNRCAASRTVPRLEVFTKNKDEKIAPKKLSEFYFKKEGVTDEKLHLFLDQCDRAVVQGNSGSLISALSDPRKKIGVLHLFIADKDKIWSEIESKNVQKLPLDYYYTGNDNVPRRFAWGFGEFLIASGTVLEAMGPIAKLKQLGLQ